MPRSIALLFSGQGSQQVGMGKDLCQQFAVAANRFAEADAALGYSISEVAFNGPLDELTKTSRCQVALYVHGLALLEVLRDQLGELDFVAAAGLSLGELTAHAAAETFDFLTGLRLVANRSRYMEEACNSSSGTMAAFIGGAETDVRRIAREADVDVANLNSPGQIVLSGNTANIHRAIEMAKEEGIRRALRLNVAGAFHSRLMRPAQERLEHDLSTAPIGHPRASVIANVTATPATEESDIRRTLAQQVTGSVRWSESVDYLIDKLHCDLFLELGPGEVLAGLVQRIRKGTEVISAGNTESLLEAAPKLQNALRAS